MGKDMQIIKTKISDKGVMILTIDQPNSSANILNEEFFNQPHEVTFRSLTEIIRFVGNKYYSVRGKKVDVIIGKLKGKNKFTVKLTLGNCIINKVNRSIIVVKEH